MESSIGLRGIIALLMLCFIGAASATTVDEVAITMSQLTAGGNADGTQTSSATVAANGDVSLVAAQGLEAKAMCGKSDVLQTSTQSVTKANDVFLHSINAVEQTSLKGGSLGQSNSQSTNNKGDTTELAVNTGEQNAGLMGEWKDSQINSQNGYGAKNNEVTGINDLLSMTGPCGEITAIQKNTKGIDPETVVALDTNNFKAKSGTIGLIQLNDDTIGATKSIGATLKNNADTFVWKTSTVDQKDKAVVFSPGNMKVLSSNGAESIAFGDASVGQGIKTDANTQPWGPSLPSQIVSLGSFNNAEVTSIFDDATSNQNTQTNVH